MKKTRIPKEAWLGELSLRILQKSWQIRELEKSINTLNYNYYEVSEKIAGDS